MPGQHPCVLVSRKYWLVGRVTCSPNSRPRPRLQVQGNAHPAPLSLVRAGGQQTRHAHAGNRSVSRKKQFNNLVAQGSAACESCVNLLSLAQRQPSCPARTPGRPPTTLTWPSPSLPARKPWKCFSVLFMVNTRAYIKALILVPH